MTNPKLLWLRPYEPEETQELAPEVCSPTITFSCGRDPGQSLAVEFYEEPGYCNPERFRFTWTSESNPLPAPFLLEKGAKVKCSFVLHGPQRHGLFRHFCGFSDYLRCSYNNYWGDVGFSVTPVREDGSITISRTETRTFLSKTFTFFHTVLLMADDTSRFAAWLKHKSYG